MPSNQSVCLEFVHWGLCKPPASCHEGPLGPWTSVRFLSEGPNKVLRPQGHSVFLKGSVWVQTFTLTVPTAWEHVGIGFRVAQ
jgi:hypothetical protein